MTTRQRLVVFFGALITLFLAFLITMALAKSKEDLKPKKSALIIRKVETAYVDYTSVKTNVTGTGRVLSQRSVDLIAEVQGKLLKGDIELKKGASFSKGQLLVRVYNRDAVYSMKSRKSSFLNSLANLLPDLKIDYGENYSKWESFFESLNIDENLPALPKINSSQEKIFLASRGVLSEYYSIKADEERLKKYNIWAPFSGSVQEVMLEAGSVANPGSRIAKIIQTSELELEVPLPVSDAHWVKKGQGVSLKSESGKIIGKGIVKREATYVDPNSQSINVYISVLSNSEALYAGQYLKVDFSGMLIKEAMEIPRNAAFNGNMVFVVDSGYLAKREIEVLKTNEKTIVFKGLEKNTELVVQPLANANANMPVQTTFTNLHKPSTDTLRTDKKAEQ